MFTYLNRLRVYEFIIKETWGFKKKINCGFYLLPMQMSKIG